MRWLWLLSTLAFVWTVQALGQTNCSCSSDHIARSCGVTPGFMFQDEGSIARKLGFDVPGDNVYMAGTVKGLALYIAFGTFLEKSDRARMFYPEYYTKAAQNASVLTLDSVFAPKNPTETDEYFRCTIPRDKYCLYKNSLRPYLGLAAKASGIPYSFLACQSYVESRFVPDARSKTGALGYSQVQPGNVTYLNEILQRAMQKSGRQISSLSGPRKKRITRVQHDIASLWRYYWQGTKKIPRFICNDDLMCNRQSFLAQVLSLKTDMLAMATSAGGIKTDFDADGDFRLEKMDKGDSLLMLAGSYNIGVTKMVKLVTRFCSGSAKLKDCLERMKRGTESDEPLLHDDVWAAANYITRIRDCSQQFSAEQLDFDDLESWTHEVRTEKQNRQREETVKCLLNPCPLPSSDLSTN